MNSARTYAKASWDWARCSKGRMIGLSIIASLIIIGFAADSIAPYSLNDRFAPFLSPSWEHPVGTNDMGKDIFTEIIYGTRLSLEVGFLSALFSLTVGVAVGIVSGYYRGRAEQIMLAITDAVIIIPMLPLLIILVSYLEPGIVSIAIAISIVGWCGMARLLHPRIMNMREQPYVEAAKGLGKSDWYIITRHIIPNCREVISAKFSLAVGGAMLAESSIAFLGLGDPLHLSWGGIINEAYTCGGLARDLWWWYLIPGLLISICILSFLMIGSCNKEERWSEE